MRARNWSRPIRVGPRHLCPVKLGPGSIDIYGLTGTGIGGEVGLVTKSFASTTTMTMTTTTTT